jgi:hypothetical protein
MKLTVFCLFAALTAGAQSTIPPHPAAAAIHWPWCWHCALRSMNWKASLPLDKPSRSFSNSRARCKPKIGAPALRQKVLRRKLRASRTPIVFLTALVPKAETRSGLQIQERPFFATPISIPELVAAIERTLPA